MSRRLAATVAPLAVLGLALAGCGDKAEDQDAAGTPGDTAATTYYADLAPVLAENCTRCHHEGGLGAADFTDPDTVVAWGESILDAVQSGRMPPAVADPSCQDYVGSEVLTVDADELAVIEAWVSEGKVLGDPESLPLIEEVKGTLDDPDLLLTIAEPYTPTYTDARNPDNEYRCFVLDPELEETMYITDLAPVVDQEAMVHHVVLFTASRNAVSEAQAAPEGFDCIDGTGESSAESMVAAWAPGMLPVELPEGVGIAVTENEVLILQMHYYDNGQTEGLSDQSSYAFNITDEVDQVAQIAPVGSFSFTIPAGEEAYTIEDGFTNSYVPLEIFGVFPHMHKLGTAYENWIEHADGSTTCLASGEYDFDNQLTYQYPEPIELGIGDTIKWSCTWNNSASNPALQGQEPQNTGYGERTDEEMCFMFSLIALAN